MKQHRPSSVSPVKWVNQKVKISFETRAEEDRSVIVQKNSKPRADRGAENQLVKKSRNLGRKGIEVLEINFEPQAEEDRRVIFQKNSKPRADRGAEYQFVEIPEPRAEEEGNIALDLVWRSYWSLRKTLNLARTEEQSISWLKIPNLVRKREGTSKPSNDSNLEQKRMRIAKFIRNF